MVMFDTNMILRYLLDDNDKMATEADRYLTEEIVFVTIEVVAEVVYVLGSVYSAKREEIVTQLTEFLQMVYCTENDVLTLALTTYGNNNLDFVDCVLYAYSRLRNFEIATFDKKLLKLLAKGREFQLC